LSLFSHPLNSWHRLINGGRDAVKYLAVTNAPMIMDAYRNEEFVFNCPFIFTDRFAGEEGYFKMTGRRFTRGHANLLETNFVSDISSVELDVHDVKGAGVQLTHFQMAGNTLILHVSYWPAGCYHKAHYHGPGSILLGLESEGYVLMWPKELGIRPYETGHGDRVVEMKWKEGSLYCPPNGWFHQHLNTGSEPARQLALRYGGRVNPTGFKLAAKRHEEGTTTSIKDGGTMIEYEDEDPEIRRRFEAKLKRAGITCEMPQVSYT